MWRINNQETEMTANKHMKIAGILQIVTSLMSLPFGIMYVVLYIRDIQEGTYTYEFQMALLLALILFMAACPLWFGIAILMKKRWVTRVPGFLCCIPSLFFFTIPLVAGVYTIWVLIRIRRVGSREPSTEHEALGASGRRLHENC